MDDRPVVDPERRGISGGAIAAIVVLGIAALVLIAWLVLADRFDGGVAVDIEVTASPADDETAADDEEAVAEDEEQEVDPPRNAALAEIRSAEITEDGDDLVFTAELARTIPENMPNESFDLAWRLYDAETQPLWQVTGTVLDGPQAIINEQLGPQDFSTLEEDFPGSAQASGNSFTITIDTAQLSGFPSSFLWELEAVVQRTNDPNTGVAKDRFPVEGFAEHPE